MLRFAWWLGVVVLCVGACSGRDGPPAEADAGGADAGRDAGADTGGFDDLDGGADGGVDGGVAPDAALDGGVDGGEADAQVGVCASDEDCRTGFCDFADDACGTGGGGTCESPAELCSLDCPGVCGCDGRFYCNTCLAHAASVDVDADGAACRATTCTAMDAAVTGDCDLSFGFAWNGVRCVGLSGCSCAGADCTDTFGSSEACEHAYRACLDAPEPGGTCGTIAGLVCGPTEFCDYEPSCNVPDAAGTCRVRPEICLGIYDPVCGCDGRTYSNDCVARSAGMDVAFTGECDAAPPPPA